MKPPACAMASLVEAKRDGRLGDREASSLARHLGTCAACRELERGLEEVRVLLRRPTAPRATLLDHQRSRLALIRAAALPPPPAPPLRSRATLTVTALVAVAGVSLAGVAPLRPRVAPIPPARYLPAVAFHQGTGASLPPRAEVAADVEPSSPYAEVLAVSTGGTVASPPSRLPGSLPVRTALRGSPAARTEQKHKTRGEPRQTPIVTGLTGTIPPEGEGDASKAFGDAVGLLGRGDYAAARAHLDAFCADHPADGRVDLAAFLTIVSLQHAGRHTEAREAARRYLERYPNGDRRAEAARVASAP